MQAGTLPAGHAGATERAALAQALQASRLFSCTWQCNMPSYTMTTSFLGCFVSVEKVKVCIQCYTVQKLGPLQDSSAPHTIASCCSEHSEAVSRQMRGPACGSNGGRQCRAVCCLARFRQLTSRVLNPWARVERWTACTTSSCHRAARTWPLSLTSLHWNSHAACLPAGRFLGR